MREGGPALAWNQVVEERLAPADRLFANALCAFINQLLCRRQLLPRGLDKVKVE
jgi:hypothetical protein